MNNVTIAEKRKLTRTMPSENIRAAMSNKNDNMAVSNISKKAKDLSIRAGPQTTTKTAKTTIKLKTTIRTPQK